MSTPELIPEQQGQPEVQPIEPRVEQPIVPETIQSIGVQAPPQVPHKVVSDDNQVLVQPVVTTVTTDLTHVITVPLNLATNEQELEKGAHGPANLSVTWLDMYWLREVGKALKSGWRVIFGQK